MICTGVVPCCPLAWLKITKLCPCLSYSSGYLENLALFSKTGDKPYTKAVKQDILIKSFKGITGTYQRIFQQNIKFLWKKCGFSIHNKVCNFYNTKAIGYSGNDARGTVSR